MSPSAAIAQTAAVALTGARLIDGRGGVIEQGVLVMREGKVVATGRSGEVTVPAGAQRVDLKGATVMPGIVNAHGHLTSADGMRNDPQGYTRDNLQRQLGTYARYGVTTVFSLGDDQEAAFTLRNEQRRGTFNGSRLYVAGPVIAGATADAALAMTDKVIAMQPEVLKMRIDDNLGSSSKMPEEAWRAVMTRAGERKLPVAVHIFYLADAKAALQAGARIIAHSVRDVPVDQEFVREMKARGACYTPTFMREVSTFVYGSTPPWTRDPFFLRGASNAVADELSDPQRQKQVQDSGAYKQGLRYKEGLEVATRNLKTLVDAGAHVAMGTDSGPAGRWQGFFEHLELEMMVNAGMTPMQVIVAATSGAAACHGKSGEFGSLQPGAAADLLILNGNPLDDIRNTRQIRSVWIAGQEVK